MTPSLKPLLLISLALTLLILTAGCLDDLSSTLPPCCDGTCDGVKTSVITFEEHWGAVSGPYYIRDSDDMLYTWEKRIDNGENILSHDNHNVTFSYSMVNGHRHITGIIKDHDAKKPACGCDCLASCAQNCSYPLERCVV